MKLDMIYMKSTITGTTLMAIFNHHYRKLYLSIFIIILALYGCKDNPELTYPVSTEDIPKAFSLISRLDGNHR
ncbi:MAG: hypothetical protein ACLUFH_07800 [Monoglobales bacterium]